MKRLQFFICVLICIAAVGFHGPGGRFVAQDAPVEIGRDVTDAVARNIEEGRFMILRYDNCRATLDCTLKGDAGGTSTLTAQFDGLIILCEPLLTHLRSRGGPMSASICDLYHIYPQRLTVRMNGRVVYYIPGQEVELTWAKIRNATMPDIPAGTMTQAAVMEWHKKIRQRRGESGLMASFTVIDKRKAGGTAVVHPLVYASGGNDLTRRSTDRDGKVTTTMLPLLHHVSGGLPASVPIAPNPSLERVDWRNTNRAELKAESPDFSLLDLSIHHRFRIVGTAERFSDDPRNDKTVTANVFYSVGLQKEVDAELSPVASDEDSHLPRPNTKREYKLDIRSPKIGEVEAIRFQLSGVSRHPGAVTNAGCHILCKSGGVCDHCNTGRKMTNTTSEQAFGSDGMVFPSSATTSWCENRTRGTRICIAFLRLFPKRRGRCSVPAPPGRASMPVTTGAATPPMAIVAARSGSKANDTRQNHRDSRALLRRLGRRRVAADPCVDGR